MSRDTIVYLPREAIVPNPHQARKTFDQDALEELANSIRIHGIQNPLHVVVEGEKYVLIAGERRLRAAGIAGLETVPAIIKPAGDIAILSLVENIQREDISPLEEAAAYQELIDRGETQESISRLVGKSRTYIAQKLRLLTVGEGIKTAMTVDWPSGRLSEGGVRQLLRLSLFDSIATKPPITDESWMDSFADSIVWGPNYARSVKEIQFIVDWKITHLFFLQAFIEEGKMETFEDEYGNRYDGYIEEYRKAMDKYFQYAESIPEDDPDKRAKLLTAFSKLDTMTNQSINVYMLVEPDFSRLTKTQQEHINESAERYCQEVNRRYPAKPDYIPDLVEVDA